MKKFAVSLFVLTAFLVFAAVPLFADGAHYEKYYPAPESPAPGEFAYGALWQMWIPPQTETLRGVVVHQHGCGIESCEGGKTAVFDLHWQSLARKYNCALMAVSYEQTGDCVLWCDPRNGSGDLFFTALADFALMSSHPELTVIPWALWGHSGGAKWCGAMTRLYPERVVGTWLRSGHTFTVGTGPGVLPYKPELRQVPILFNIGTSEREGRMAHIWNQGFRIVEVLRADGAKFGYLIDPHTEHETGDSRYPAIRFLDECLAARLPAVPGDSALRPSPEGVVLSAGEEKDEQVKPFLKNGFWLPSEGFAEVWRRYAADCSFDDETPPPAARDLRLTPEGLLSWDLTADPESGFASVSIEWNGSVWRIPEENRNPFGRNVYQGLRYSDTPCDPVPPLEFQIPDYRPDAGPVTMVIYNTCGLPSEPVSVEPAP